MVVRDTAACSRNCLVDFNAEKAQFFSFDESYNSGAIDVKMSGSVFKKKPSFKILGLSLSSKLDWGSYNVSIAKTASAKIGALIQSRPWVKLLFISIQPCMEYWCHVCAGAPSRFLDMLDKLKK